MMLALAIGTSCSVERHYRVLSFFFDGVPDPSLPPPAEPEVGPVVAAERGGPRVPIVKVSQHQPVLAGECNACHIQSKDQFSDWVNSDPTLRAERTELCGLCHEPPKGPYTHGPAASAQCQICHQPHRSIYPNLLRAEHPRDLCVQCHDSSTFLTRAEHEARGDMECAVCHDPHRSDLPYLLRSEEQIRQRTLDNAQEESTDEPGGL
jgi:predicted CXXCH cytochrome family protein